MKTRILSVSALVLTIAAVIYTAYGCSKNKREPVDTDPPDQSSAVETPPFIPGGIPQYELVSHIIPISESDPRCGRMVLILPRFEGDGNAPLEELIAVSAGEHFAAAVPNAASYIAEAAEVDYEVTEFRVTRCDGYIFSARVSGRIAIAGAPHQDEFIYTINIKTSGEEYIKLDSSDIISNYEGFCGAFTGDGFRLVYGRPDLSEHTRPEDMISQYPASYGVYPDIYLTSDSLVVNINLVAALGFNAGFAIPLEQAGFVSSSIIPR